MEIYTITIYIREYDDFEINTFVREDYQSALEFALGERNGFKKNYMMENGGGYYERILEGTCIDAYFKDNSEVSFEATIKKHEIKDQNV